MQLCVRGASGLVGRDGARLFVVLSTRDPAHSIGPLRTASQAVHDGAVAWNETFSLQIHATRMHLVLWDNTLLAPGDYAAAAELTLQSIGAQSLELKGATGERMGKLEVQVQAHTGEADDILAKRPASDADVAAMVKSMETRPERDVKRELLAMKSKWLSSGSSEDLMVDRHSRTGELRDSGSKKEKKEKVDRKEKKEKDKDKERKDSKKESGTASLPRGTPSGSQVSAKPLGELAVDLGNLGLSAYPILPSGVLLVDLSFNHLASLTIPTLSNVLTLNLNANRISMLGLPPNAPLLRDFYLRDNALASVALPFMAHISVLDLGNNRLTALPDLAPVQNVTHLLLDGNPLASLDALPALAHLQSLDVSRCGLTSLPVSISLLTCLNSLHARANALMGVPHELALMTHLRLLSLADNVALRHVPLQVARMTSLVIVDVHNTALSSPMLEAAQHGGQALRDHLRDRLQLAIQHKQAVHVKREAALAKVKEKHRIVQSAELGHCLVVRHVTKRVCDVCQLSISGIGRNAAACLDCGVTTHRKCAARAYASCEPSPPIPIHHMSLSSSTKLASPSLSLSSSESSSNSSPNTGSVLVRPVSGTAPRLVSLRSDSRILKRALDAKGSDVQAAEELAERLVSLCEAGVAENMEAFLVKAAQQGKDLPALLLRAHAAEANAPVHLLAYGGHTDALQVALQFDKSLVALRSGHGLLPVHLAAQMGRASALRMLVSHGADVNARELQAGHTALHLAAERGHVDCVTLLLAAGADAALGSYTGRTALDKALLKRQTGVVALLEELCARQHLPPLRSAATDAVALLGMSSADPLQWLRSGQSVLLDAFQLIRSDFELFDANGDGAVSWAELSSAYARLVPEADLAELERVFHAADADGSDTIERAEFTWLVYAWVRSAAIDSIFLMRNNGALLRQAFKLLERAFTQADADASGSISVDELRLFLSHLNGIYPAMSEHEMKHRLKSLRISLKSEQLDFRAFVGVLEAWPLPEPLPIVVRLIDSSAPNTRKSSDVKVKADYVVLDTISLAELRKAIGTAVCGTLTCTLAAVLPPRDHRRELNRESDWSATVVAFKNRRSATAPFLRLVCTALPPAPLPSFISTPSSASLTSSPLSPSSPSSPPNASPRTTSSSTSATPNSTPRTKPSGKLSMGLSLDLKAAASAESSLVASLKSPLRAREPWEIEPSLVQQGKALGQGAYGSVYQGTFKGESVAVKRLTSNDSGRAPDDLVVSAFVAEIKLMARLTHPRILRFVAACLTPPNLMCLTAFMQRGSLSDVIARNDPTFGRRVRMARDGAEGLAFLHSLRPPVVHRDVKSMNLLVDGDWRVVVADFGTSEALETEANRHAARWGTLNWMPPEVFNGQIYDLPSDVFSFGMVLWECLTGAIPFGHIANPLQVLQLIEAGERPPIPPDAESTFSALIRCCWSALPEQRPSFASVITILDKIHPPTD